MHLCRKTALRWDGRGEKLLMRRAQEVAENTEKTFTNLKDKGQRIFFHFILITNLNLSRQSSSCCLFSLKPQVREANVKVGGAAQSRDLRLAAGTAVNAFFSIVYLFCFLAIVTLLLLLLPYKVTGAQPAVCGEGGAPTWTSLEVIERKATTCTQTHHYRQLRASNAPHMHDEGGTKREPMQTHGEHVHFT